MLLHMGGMEALVVLKWTSEDQSTRYEDVGGSSRYDTRGTLVYLLNPR